MKLLDRYLAAVARNLPAKEAADITAELRDNLLSEIEEKETGLGRPLTDKELEALLIDFGHPLSVAARYRKARYLIGPEVYPFWLATLRVVGGIAAAVIVVAALVAGFSARLPPEAVARQVLEQFWPVVLGVFGSVTAVFAVMERLGKGRMQLKWSPRSLPPPRAARRKARDVISEMVVGAVFILWWTGVISFPQPVPPFIHLYLAPVWLTYYWPVLACSAFQIAIDVPELMRPTWVRVNAALSLVKNLASAIVFYEVLQAGHWLTVNAPTLPPHALQSMRQGFDRGMQIGITVTIIVMACLALRDAWRLMRGPGHDRAPTDGANGAAASRMGIGAAAR